MTILNLDSVIDLEISCLFNLDDYLWNIIVGKLSYADQLSLSETCQRFFNLIETKQISKRFKSLFKAIYSSQGQILYTIEEFICKLKLYKIEITDKLYVNYFLSILKEALHPKKKITAHLLWCQRNYSLKEDCKLCCQVIRFYDEMPTIYLHTKHYADLWEKKIEKVFSDKLHYKIEESHYSVDCQYFENIHSKAQLINLFDIIALRIFFNLSKKYLFLTQFKQKEKIYRFFLAESRGIFSTVCDNIDADYIKKVIKVLKPFVDYDATYLKITNSFYLKYLEEKCI